MNIPFLVTAPSHAQEVFRRAAALPSIPQQFDMLLEISSLESSLALRSLIGPLLGISSHLSAWEKNLGFKMIPIISSTLDLDPSNFDISQFP